MQDTAYQGSGLSGAACGRLPAAAPLAAGGPRAVAGRGARAGGHPASQPGDRLRSLRLPLLRPRGASPVHRTGRRAVRPRARRRSSGRARRGGPQRRLGATGQPPLSLGAGPGGQAPAPPSRRQPSWGLCSGRSPSLPRWRGACASAGRPGPAPDDLDRGVDRRGGRRARRHLARPAGELPTPPGRGRGGGHASRLAGAHRHPLPGMARPRQRSPDPHRARQPRLPRRAHPRRGQHDRVHLRAGDLPRGAFASVCSLAILAAIYLASLLAPKRRARG